VYIGGQIAKLVTVLIAAMTEREKGKVTAMTAVAKIALN
jgi:hypothetical protein